MRHRYSLLLTLFLLTGVGLLFLSTTPGHISAATPPETQPAQAFNLLFDSAVAQEPKDTDWAVKITGKITSLPGAYLVIHNADGKISNRFHLPAGTYTQDAPFVLNFPPDGITGEYRLIILGNESDTHGLNLPLTTLPREVYVSRTFASRGRQPLYFQSTNPGQPTKVGSYTDGRLTISSPDGPILDTQKDGTIEKYTRYASFIPQKSIVYRLQLEKGYYFNFPAGACLAASPDAWFNPDPRLEEFKWWNQ